MTLTVYKPGTRVAVDEMIEGIVASVLLRDAGCIEYRVEWWDDGDLCDSWFDACRVRVLDPDESFFRVDLK